jgi:hypothetical protein
MKHKLFWRKTMDEDTVTEVNLNDPDCDDEDCDCEDEKAEKKPKYIAIYKRAGECEPPFCHAYLTAFTANELKKLLEDIPVENICEIWKGKKKEIKSKSVITF